MRLTMSSECAIHGLLYLAIFGEGRPVLLPDLARRLGVSAHTLRKVFQSLTMAGLLVTFRGVKGGYALARAPAEITLKHVVDAIESGCPTNHCLLRRGECELGCDCAVGSVLARVADATNDALRGITLRELMESVEDREKQLTWVKV